MREGWTYKKLGEVCEVVSGSTPKTNVPEFWGNGHYWITPAEIDDATVYINKTERQITDAAIDKTHLQLLPIGTVLLSSRAPIGKVAITDTEMYCNQGFKNCICSDAIYNKFLFFFLKYKKNYLNSLGRGATFKEISKSIVEKVAIPLPPLSEQQSIVAELDKINELISLKKAQLSDLDSLAQSIFYDMFGDPIENEKGWEVKKLKDIVADDCSISYGIVQPGDGVDNGVPVVRPVDMTHTFVKRSGLKQTTKEISDSYKRTILKGNEILMCVRGTTGLVALATEDIKDCNVTRGVTPIECNADNSRLYIYHLLLTAGIQQYIANYTKGIALKQINMQDVREIPLITPPLPLQQDFAKRIELIEQQKAQISSTIKDLETLLASRMQYWFD